MDKLYVASIRSLLRIKVFSTFVMLHAGAGKEYDPKQQATAEFIDNMSMYYIIHYCIAC